MKRLLKVVIIIIAVSAIVCGIIFWSDMSKSINVNKKNITLESVQKINNKLFILESIAYNKDKDFYNFNLQIKSDGNIYEVGSGVAYPEKNQYYDLAKLVEKIKRPDYTIYNLAQPFILDYSHINDINIINPIVVLKDGKVLGNVPVGSDFYGQGKERLEYKDIKLDIARYVQKNYKQNNSIYETISQSMNMVFLEKSENYIKEFSKPTKLKV